MKTKMARIPCDADATLWYAAWDTDTSVHSFENKLSAFAKRQIPVIAYYMLGKKWFLYNWWVGPNKS